MWTATHGFYEWQATYGELRMVIYLWSSTHGSYKGLLMMLENDVSLLMGAMCDKYI